VVSPQWIGRRVRGLLRELPVRYEALVVGGCFYVLFNLALSTAALALTFAWAGVLPAPTAPLALLGVPVLIVAGLVIGTVLLPIVYVYVDFRYAMAYLSPLLMIATPIIYESPTQGLLAQVNRWNPLTVFVGVPKNWVLAGFDGREGLLASAAAAVLILLVLSLRFMRRSMPIAVERLL
jgi:lipopolysaccharide transport system permease protein